MEPVVEKIVEEEKTEIETQIPTETVVEEKEKVENPPAELDPSVSSPQNPQEDIAGPSPSRAMKIADPERRSVEFVSNGLTGCHMDELLEEKAENFTIPKKQVIILTAAGKPVYSYGRDESDISSITAIIQALDSNFAAKSERLKSVVTEKGYCVFEKIGSLLFFSYSPNEGTSIQLIREEFRLLYQQIIVLLSTAALKKLENNPSYDIRELIGNSSGSLTTLINQCGVSLYYHLRCYHPLLIPSSLRTSIREIFVRCKRPDTIYGGLGMNENIVFYLQNKQFPLSPINLVLLQNMITKTPSFRSSEGWLPVCITDVKADAFLHLYVGFVTEEMYVFFITTAVNPDDFSIYSAVKDSIYNMLLESDRIIQLYSAYNASMSIQEANIPDLIHFVYKNESSQIIIPRMDDRLYDFHDYHKMIRKYQELYSYMILNQLSEYYESTAEYSIHCTKKETSLFFVVFSPFLSVNEAIERKQLLADWLVKRNDLMIQKTHMYWFVVCLN